MVNLHDDPLSQFDLCTYTDRVTVKFANSLAKPQMSQCNSYFRGRPERGLLPSPTPNRNPTASFRSVPFAAFRLILSNSDHFRPQKNKTPCDPETQRLAP